MNVRHEPLLRWVKSASDRQVEKTGTTRAYLRLIAYGHKVASPEIAVRLEAASEGIATRQQLRPDDWHVLWPELEASDSQPTPPDADNDAAERACTDVQATPPAPKRAGQPRTATAS